MDPSNRGGATPDGIRRAWLHGTLARHAPWAAPQGAAREAALAEIREVVTGPRGELRTDVLSAVAVLFRGLEEARALGGAAEDDPERGRYRTWVALLVAAGAAEPTPDQWGPVAEFHANRPRGVLPFAKPFTPTTE